MVTTPSAFIAQSVGFVGLGKMGVPMVAQLCAGGFEVKAYDISTAASESVGSIAGCEVMPSLEAIAESTEAVITMLPSGSIVRAVVAGELGKPGLIEHLPAGALVVDMSSSAPWETRALGELLHTHGIGLVDAPVSGGVARATTGTLAIFAGGDRDLIDRARPFLGVLGSAVFYAGELGAGHATKALNNLLSAACFAATIEVLGIAVASGLDPQVFSEILNASTGRNNTTENKLRQFVLTESYDSGFTLGLMAKDLHIAKALADNSGTPGSLSSEVVALWSRALAELGADADHTEFARLLFLNEPYTSK